MLEYQSSEELKVGVNYLKTKDPIQFKIINKIGDCALKPSSNYFENLLKSIVSQQLSVKAAKSILNRLYRICVPISPNNIREIEIERLRSIGISYQKSGFVHNLANKWLENPNWLDNINGLSNKEVINELCQIKGIGEWTAQMFLIFSLNRLNVLPINDVGFRRSFIIQYGANPNSVDDEILTASENWGNYSSIAAWYLWKILDTDGG